MIFRTSARCTCPLAVEPNTECVPSCVKNDSIRAGSSWLPEVVVVDANGAFWRVLGDGTYSICPTSKGNEPIDIVASYRIADTIDLTERNPNALDPETVRQLTDIVKNPPIEAVRAARRIIAGRGGSHRNSPAFRLGRAVGRAEVILERSEREGAK